MTEVDIRGCAAVLFFAEEPATGEHAAWWAPEDGLVVVDSVPRLLAAAAAHPFGGNEERAAEFFPLSENNQPKRTPT